MLNRIGLSAGLILLGLSVAPLPAATRIPAPDDGDRTRLELVRTTSSQPSTAEILEVEVLPAAYRQMWTAARVALRDFPLPQMEPVDLELASFEVLTPGARLVQVDEHGAREVPRPGMRSFHGIAVGDPESTVTLNLFADRIAGSVRTRGEEFVIAPASFDPEAPRGQTTRIWRVAADPDRLDYPFCGSDDLESPPASSTRGGMPIAHAPAPIDGNTLLVADVAIDATYEWYAHFGSLEAAQSYILNLMAQVSTIYQDEVRVAIAVPYLRVFTTSGDPYTATTDTTTLLADLRSEWNDNQTAIERTVTHLFSVRPSGGAGLAYVDVLCNHAERPGSSYDYGVSTLSAGGSSWEKKLVAHELGHSFSSRHTHCYVPEIDQCANESGCYQGPIVQTVGTLMSYCAATTAVFHPRVENEQIRPAAEDAYPTCIAVAPSEVPPQPPLNLTVD